MKISLKFFLIAIISTGAFINSESAFSQKLEFSDALTKIRQNYNKFASYEKTIRNFDTESYGKCANVGIAIAAESVKGSNLDNMTIYTGALLMSAAEVYHNNQISKGMPEKIFEHSLATYAIKTKEQFSDYLSQCLNIIPNITDSKK